MSSADYDALLSHVDGIHVVVHLTAVVSHDCPGEDVLEHDIIGTQNVFKASRAWGCRARGIRERANLG